MTNAEKFVEVFGTDLKRQYATKTWWEQEFIPNKAIPTGWIPVSERLPKDDEQVLVTRRMMFHWANEPVEYAVGIESFSGNIDFVAWMPLPEPYKASPTGVESE